MICCVCGSYDLDLVFVFKFIFIGDDYVIVECFGEVQLSYFIDLFMCGQCGLVQIIDIIDLDVLYGNYIYVI